MIIYLTSDPGGAWETDSGTDRRDYKNAYGFRRKLKKDLKETAADWNELKCLLIASDPQDRKSNDKHQRVYLSGLRRAGIPFTRMDVCDARHPEYTDRLNEYDMVYLMGGHAPTQNAFLKKLGLREKIKDYEGIVLTLSAGSMNCAENVYLIPEYEEELEKPEADRFTQGLGLTDIQMVPHFQWLRNITLDGKSVVNDIICKDSFGHRFIAVCDDGYFRIDQSGRMEKFGEMYIIADGQLKHTDKNMWR